MNESEPRSYPVEQGDTAGTYEQLPDNFADLVDELSRPIVSDNGTIIPPAL